MVRGELVHTFDQSFLNAWNIFVHHHRDATVMQSYFAYQLFQGTRNYKPTLFCCFNQNNDISGLLLAVTIKESRGIKGYFSSRTVVYGGPLICNSCPDKSDVLAVLLEQLNRHLSKSSLFIQFRPSVELSDFLSTFKEYGFEWNPRMNLLIQTHDRNKVIQGISKSRWRQVQRSLRNGAEIVEPDTLKQIHEFYRILFDLYRNKIKKPLPDRSFFETFWSLSRQSSNGKIFLIEVDGKIVGGIVTPFLTGKSVFEWYVCGLDAEMKPKGIFPSVLATWAALDFAVRENFEIFDFMGVGKPDVPYGVRDFKMRFGGNIVNYGRYIKVNNKLLYSIAEFGFNVLALLKRI